jgi:hypothetical protein
MTVKHLFLMTWPIIYSFIMILPMNYFMTRYVIWEDLESKLEAELTPHEQRVSPSSPASCTLMAITCSAGERLLSSDP